MADLVTTIFIYGFVFGFFILIAVGLMSLVIPHKKRPRNIKEFFKIYWGEMFLVICMIVSAYFFVKGVGI